METEKPIEELTFEEAFHELELVVNQLEADDRTLEEALQLFERGQTLAERCGELLDQAELKVQKITGSGLAPLEEFDNQE